MKTKEMKPKLTKIEKASILKEPLTHLKLTLSIHTILLELGINTIGELVSTPIEMLMSHRKFTSTSLGIVDRDLAMRGIELLDAEGYRAAQTEEHLDTKQKDQSAKVKPELQETKPVEEISKPKKTKKPEKQEEIIAIEKEEPIIEEEEEPMDSLQDLEKQLKKTKKKGIKKGEKLAKRKIIKNLLESGRFSDKKIYRYTETKRSVIKKIKAKMKKKDK